jgi:hypothetical protein
MLKFLHVLATFRNIGQFLFNYLVTLILTKLKIVWARVFSAKVARLLI